MDKNQTTLTLISDCYPKLSKELLKEIADHSRIQDFVAKEAIVTQGQYIRFLPLVLSGRVKVYSYENEVQFLLYFIAAGGACVYSFAHAFNEEYAGFSAVAESDSQLLMLPLEKVNAWLQMYPTFSSIILGSYQRHFSDLLDTTKQIICYNLDERLLEYLRKRKTIEGTDLISISHQEIATDLGTSREVITRLMKKLGKNGQIKQVGRKIKML